MNNNEIKYLNEQIDKNIMSCKDWIKHYYGDMKVDPQRAIDLKSIELDRQLEMYYHLRKQKDEIIKQYELRKTL